ncbi:MAG: hypothetical protein LBC77_02700 [Spirochaetaceae bacterium]|jgi:hypothetical protein|nr:hypothetical protein [Spirochaetaceae bacterium]
MKVFLLAALFSGLFFAPAPFFSPSRAHAADVLLDAVSDDSALRSRLAATLFIDPPSKVLSLRPLIERLDSGERVQVRVERGAGDEFSLVLARERSGAFPYWQQGSFILTRSASTGDLLRARFFPRSDANTYLEFRPLSKTKSEMDAVVYDGFVVKSLPVPVPFEKLVAAPFSATLGMLAEKFPRRYFEPSPALYRDIRLLIREIRGEIKTLEFADDGALDENNAYILINSLSPQTGAGGLNCSGFAKWVVDGLLRPVTGRRLAVEPLKQPYGERGTNFTEPFERVRDPFFGLDWVRNLAAAASSTFKSPAFAALPEIEVRKSPFAAIIRRAGRANEVRSYPEHLPNAGFGFEGIQPLLYTLAIDEPQHIFLGAISTQGGTPPLRTYFHVVVLAPYFDESGTFRVALFESAAETSFNRFRTRYQSHHINLCRVPIETSFTP